MKRDTIVIGGGMAGISCALKLKENHKEYFLITDRLGGRVCYSEEYNMNFGAVFYMENYIYAKRILTHGPRLKFPLNELKFHHSDKEIFSPYSFRMVKNLPQAVRFFLYMKKFSKHYERFKKDCETQTVEASLEKNAFIKKLYYRSANEVMKELRITAFCDDLVSKFAFACTGVGTDKLNALDFFNVAQSVYLPIYEFRFEEESLARSLGENLVFDSVKKVTSGSKSHFVTTANGKTLECKNLVIATPASVTQKLLNIEKIRKPSSLITYLLEGRLKYKYKHYKFRMFSDAFNIILLQNRDEGKCRYALYATEEIDLDEYFSKYEILKLKKWDDALYVHGQGLLEQNYGNNLYTAGDHNGLGMEPACISGIYAANQIIEKETLH